MIVSSVVLIGTGCSRLESTTAESVSRPVTDAEVDVVAQPNEKPFPTELIGKKPSVTDRWITPVALLAKDGCVTNPDGDLGGEMVNPKCLVWSEATVSAEKGIVAQVVPVDVAEKKGEVRFMTSGKQMNLPPLPVFVNTNVEVTFVNDKTVLILTSGYEWMKQVRLQGNEWQDVVVPKSVLVAFPWEPKPPFNLALGETFDRYTETRWPPGAEGYFGDDEYRSKWVLSYIVDRQTGDVVDTEVLARP